MQGPDRCFAIRKKIFDPACTPLNRATPFHPRPEDVIIAGHRKSGTTWMQQVIHQIRTKGDENFKSIFDVVPYLPDYRIKTHTNLNDDQVSFPRVFKSHDLYECIPKVDGYTRFVVTMRNPYDAEWSQIKYVWRIFGDDRDMSPMEYEQIASLDTDNDFASFMQSWWSHRNDPNVLLILYEDMKKDLPSCIQKVALFIYGKTLAEADLSRVLQYCSFEYMSNHSDKFDMRDLISYWSEVAQLEKIPVSISNVRTNGGQVGQGTECLHEIVRRQIDKRWNETMERKYGMKSYNEMYQIYSNANNEA